MHNSNVDDEYAFHAEFFNDTIRYLSRNNPGKMPQSNSKAGGRDWLPVYFIVGVLFALIAIGVMAFAPIAVLLFG